MTDADAGHNRQTAGRILEWFLIGMAALWFGSLPLAMAAAFAFIPEAREGVWRQAAFALAAGGLQMGGLLVAIALGKLVPSWNKLFLTGLALTLAAGWSTLAGLIRVLLSDYPNWTAVLQLLVGIPYLLGLGGWLAGRARNRNLLQTWADLGLTRSGSLGWGLAAAALVLWPWLLVGSLGDVHESAAIALQSLASGLLIEWLWRGLALSLLLSMTRRRWAAGLLGGLLYLGYEMGTLVLGAGEKGIWQVMTAFALAFLVTELWARPGKGQHGVWGAVVFHTLYLALPRLFTDPRSEFELTHIVTQLYMPITIGVIALFLLVGRKLWAHIAKPLPRSKLRSAAIAALPWTAVLGAYLVFGAPGFANDGYLIIFREQADLAPASEIADREGRLVFIHTLLVETAERGQAEICAELDEMKVSYRPYYLVNMIRVDGTTRGMETFARRPEVAQVIRNPNVREYPIYWKIPYDSSAEGSPDTPWGVDKIDAEQVWELGITGVGIVVAGQDTGYDWEHPALKDSYRGWDGREVDHNTNWHDAWDDKPAAFDDDSHGTHTIGTVAGNEVGVAPDAQWIGCRNMRHGLGNPGSYVECMEFFLAPYPVGGDPFRDGDPTLAPHVVNNSWGCPPEEGCIGPEPIHTAVEALRAAGIMMVVSAGNEGPNCSTVWIPASEDAVFAVGASDEWSKIVSFSSRGPATGGLLKPDVVAPGVNVDSSVPGGAYASAGGTSMAGPHVVGLVALLWSANPDLIGDIDRTEQIITQTAQPHTLTALCPAGGGPCACGQHRPGQTPNNVYGYGVIDALAAVEAALEMRE